MSGAATTDNHRTRRWRRLAGAWVVLVAAVLIGVGTAGTAGAATGNELTLTSQTTWVGGGGTSDPDLVLGLHVAASDPASTMVQVSVYGRLVTRSDFAATLDDKVHGLRRAFDPVALSSLTEDGPGSYLFDIPVNPSTQRSGVSSLLLSVPGVYPVQVALVDRSGHSLAKLTTHLLFTGKSPLDGKPLAVSLVAPLHAAPAVASDGRPAALPVPAQTSLDELTGALVAHPGVPVTLEPTPQTVESLAAGSDTDKATLARVQQLAGAGSDQVVTAPYVPVNAATLAGVGLDSELTDQMRAGGLALGTSLRMTPGTQTVIEPGAISAAGIDDLISQGATRLLVDGAALSPLPAGLDTLTLAQPFELAGRSGRRVAAVSTDPGLEAHFTNGPAQVLAAHQLLADLAVIQQERPNLGRGVAVAIPQSWPVAPSFMNTLLDGLQSSPMLAPVALDRLFATVTPVQAPVPAQSAQGRSGTSTLLRAPANEQPATPGISDAAAIRSARGMLDGLASFAPDAPAIGNNLERLLLVAESSDLADRQRPAAINTLTGQIGRMRSVVHLPASQSITLTARQGRIPITVASSAPYTVRVRIHLSSQKLAFHGIEVVGGSCLPGGSADTCLLDLHTQNTTLTVPVEARTSGVYPFKIDLSSPDGALLLTSGQYTVRSTAASGVGIFLSVAAALLLAGWWARDLRHGRRSRQLVPGPAGEGGNGAAPEAAGEATPAPPWDGGVGAEASPPVPATPTAANPAVPDAPATVAPSALAIARFDRITEPIPVIRPASVPPSSAEAAPAPASTSAATADPDPLSAVFASSEPWSPDPSSSASAALPPVPPPRGRPPGRSKTGDGSAGSFSRNTMTVAGGTLLSRLTGFGRVLALVWALHVTRLGDIYNIANTVPNILYDLVLGGILSATLVPVFVDYLGREDEDETWRAISAVCTAILAALVVLSVAFFLLVPVIIHFYLILNHSPGAADERAVGVTLLRLFVPQLFLLGGIAVTTALLNARRHFVAPAFSPIVNNVVAIVAIVATRLVATSLGLASFRHDTAALLLLGLGTTAGYLLQLVFQLPPILRGRYHLRPVWDLRHPAVRTVLRLSLWTFGAVIANQVAFNLVLVLAGRKSGDVVVFTTAYQFFQLPYAIFAVSIAAVITPDLSERWATGDVKGFRRQMAGGLRLTLAVVVPAAVGYIALAHPLLTLVFHHGSFPASDAHRIGTVVALFAVGLPGFSVFLLLMRAYQSMQDTRSMFWLYVVENGATIVLALALYPAMGVGGLALGWVSAYTVGSVVAYLHVRRRTGGMEGKRTVSCLARVGVATLIMVGAVLGVRGLVNGASDQRLLVEVVVGVTVGAIVYLAACRFLGVGELDALFGRRPRPAGAHSAGHGAGTLPDRPSAQSDVTLWRDDES